MPEESNLKKATRELIKPSKGPSLKDIVEATFPEDVMKEIGSDHHKSRDGILSIEYDYYSGTWSIHHPGYCRELGPITDEDFSVAAYQFINNIADENEKILYGRTERLINEALNEDRSISLSDNGISFYDKKGFLKSWSLKDWKSMPVEDLIKMVKEKFGED